MRPWNFSRPKGPGFGLSKSLYVSVLSSASVLPRLRDLVDPKGTGGAVEGFVVPLAEGTSKEALDAPFQRGGYGVASKDRKTVLRMLVLGRDEANYDPEAFARSSLAATASDELLSRMRGAWTLSQFTFETHDPEVYPALDFLQAVTTRFAELSEGVVADPIARRYLLPEHVVQIPRVDPKIDAREWVSINSRIRPDGVHLHTLGMRKFALPEIEIVNLADADVPLASRLLIMAAQASLMGDLMRSGDRFGDPKVPFEAREGGFDRELWDGSPVFELLPPTHITPGDALTRWDQSVKRELS